MRNIDELKERYQKGEDFNYLFFWGHRQKDEKIIDKSSFSQWFPVGFSIEDVYYKTAEHYMMAKKAELFDVSMVESILKASSPKRAKELGRRVKNFDEKLWDERSFDIVIEGNRAKFSQNHELKKFLLSTSNRVIVEASPYDKIWGIGMSADNKQATNPTKWRGENRLGFALMVVRELLNKMYEEFI